VNVSKVDFVGVPVQDLARSEEFYSGTLGLTKNPNSHERWVEYEIGDLTLALISPAAMGPDFEVKPHSMPIAFRVDDVEAAKAELAAKGVEFRGDTIDSGVCHIVPFKDPDGNSLQLHHRYAPFKDGTQP
jgi:catechol 2,3-dioxygenase-like lactoylglutathione lyase family enzyme